MKQVQTQYWKGYPLTVERIDLEYHPDWLNAVALGKYLDRIEREFVLTSLLPDRSVHRIVDLSGGSGRLAVPLRQRGYEVIVTDVDLVPLRRLAAKQRGIQLEMVDARARVLPLATGSVDAALCIQVPFYVEDGRSWFFDEVCRIVRPGGWLIATATNRLSYKGLIRRSLIALGRLQPRSWHRFEYVSTPGELAARLAQAGFSVERCAGYNWVPTLRFSDTDMLPWFAALESGLGLDRLAAISPWIIMSARRTAPASEPPTGTGHVTNGR